MKKYYFLFVCFFIFAGVFNACSDDESVESQKTVQTKSELVTNLEVLNNQILSNNKKSRGFFSWKTCAVAVADIRGALEGAKAGASLGAKVGMVAGSPHTGAVTFAFIGGCALGAFDSYVAHRSLKGSRDVSQNDLDYATISTICQHVISDDLTFVDSTIEETSGTSGKLVVDNDITGTVHLEARYLNVGKVHNVILGVTDGSVKLITENNMGNRAVSDVLNSTEFRKMYDDITYKKLNNINIERNELEEKVIDLFCDVFQQYSANCNDVAYIINKYIEILEESDELTEIQMNSIKTGLATALYSFNYWDHTLK